MKGRKEKRRDEEGTARNREREEENKGDGEEK